MSPQEKDAYIFFSMGFFVGIAAGYLVWLL